MLLALSGTSIILSYYICRVYLFSTLNRLCSEVFTRLSLKIGHQYFVMSNKVEPHTCSHQHLLNWKLAVTKLLSESSFYLIMNLCVRLNDLCVMTMRHQSVCRLPKVTEVIFFSPQLIDEIVDYCGVLKHVKVNLRLQSIGSLSDCRYLETALKFIKRPKRMRRV